MCGIVGFIVAESLYTEDIYKMVKAVRHRGPDGSGVWEAKSDYHQIHFGHTRLSILDLSTAASQPMRDAETGCVISYNGEVYNYQEIAARLSPETRAKIKSTGDTEVLLRSYIQEGINFVSHLRGMFAFSIYDPRLNKLYLVRDHYGIKPLYYTFQNGNLAFASELRAILALPWVKKQQDLQGLLSLLAFGSVQEPYTLIKDVYALPPSHYLSIDLNSASLEVSAPQAYANPVQVPQNNFFADSRELSQEVYRTLKDSVQAHLISDVPIGAFLSGGIDSSAIVALMAEKSSQVHTLTVAFNEAGYDESQIAREVARRYGTQHSEIRLESSDFLQDISKCLDSYDQPSSDGANTWIISRACKQAGISVALSGLGSDELFAGYSTFSRSQTLRPYQGILQVIPKLLRGMMAKALLKMGNSAIISQKLGEWLESDGSHLATYLILRRMFSADLCQELLDKNWYQANAGSELAPKMREYLRNISSGQDTIAAISLLESQSYLVNTLLRDSDQMAMAHGLEIRVPFVDRKLIDLIQQIPGQYRFDGATSKPLLRRALGTKLDDSWVNRPKMGFSFPFDTWLRTKLRGEVEETLLSLNYFPFRAGAVQGLWQKFLKNSPSINAGRIMTLYTLAYWIKHNQVEPYQ